MTLFLGPLAMMLIDGELPFQSRFYWRNQLQNLCEWIGIRNYIVGPIAEEYIFRACMVSITATSGASPKAMIFGLPLVFGIGDWSPFNLEIVSLMKNMFDTDKSGLTTFP
ncbi:hypothetical protein BGZ91_001875 [Linnemannia elongata]|nr:hypothetical protein BGZ91_001875 [Linnemannia elongata]